MTDKVSKASTATKSDLIPAADAAESVTDQTHLSAEDSLTLNGKKQVRRLTKKKQQYLEKPIEDKSGKYDWETDPAAYKKARKRMQNRESAVRSRQKKGEDMENLHKRIQELSDQKAAAEAANAELQRQNDYFKQLFQKQ